MRMSGEPGCVISVKLVFCIAEQSVYVIKLSSKGT